MTAKTAGIKKQYLYACVAILLWSTTGAVSKLLLGELTSMQVLCVTCGYASVYLLAECTVKGKWKLLKTYRARDCLIMAGNGLLGVFFYNLFLYMGIERMPASKAMIINYLWPIMAVVFGCLLLKEKLTLRKVIAVLMSFAGVVIVSTGGGQTGGTDPLGAGLCVLAAVAYGLFVVLNKRFSYDAHFSMTLSYTVTFLGSLVCVLAAGEPLALSGLQHLGMLWIGVFTCAVAYVSWALAMGTGETAQIANLAYIIPFLSMIWTFFLVGEPIELRSVLGLGVIVAGIFVQLKK